MMQMYSTTLFIVFIYMTHKDLKMKIFDYRSPPFTHLCLVMRLT